MISIPFKTKIPVIICSFMVGVIFVLFSLIQMNKTYAKVDNEVAEYTAGVVPFYWMIMLIGGVIIITLSYVSWRKYIGQKKRKQKRDLNN